MHKVGGLPIKAKAAMTAGAKTIVCPTPNVNEVPGELPLVTKPIFNLKDLLLSAFVDEQGNPAQYIEDQAAIGIAPLAISPPSVSVWKRIRA